MYRTITLALALCCSVVHPADAQETPASTDSAFASLILDEVARHPLMESADLYKFVHQSAMGPGHAIEDPESARRWMEREVAALESVDPVADEALFEFLRPDSALVRVNLRPYLAAGHESDSLLSAFIATANSYQPSPERLERGWQIVASLAISGTIPHDIDSLRTFFQSMREAGFPAVHHSSTYTEAYRPAYRVVSGDLVGSLIGSDP
jgi:hypothetical protein